MGLPKSSITIVSRKNHCTLTSFNSSVPATPRKVFSYQEMPLSPVHLHPAHHEVKTEEASHPPEAGRGFESSHAFCSVPNPLGSEMIRIRFLPFFTLKYKISFIKLHLFSQSLANRRIRIRILNY